MSGYVGVRSVAKKIDKLYVGDGAGISVARPWEPWLWAAWCTLR